MNIYHLKESVESIEMPEEMKDRLIRNCRAMKEIDNSLAPYRIASKKVWCSVCACCLVVVLAIGIWRSGVLNEPEIVPDQDNQPIMIAHEFVASDHRPEGFDEHIGTVLALKMSIVDDADYRFRVILQFYNIDIEQTIKSINSETDVSLDIDEIRLINVKEVYSEYRSEQTYTREKTEYYCELTADQIFELAKNGVNCLYVGSGEGNYKDANWDTPEGINTYCELDGDMYVLKDNYIESHPDIFVVESEPQNDPAPQRFSPKKVVFAECVCCIIVISGIFIWHSRRKL